MKKFLIAAAVVVLAAFAVPAFAATNPFMDVPASHWAYDAVAQLAARGVVSGYPDGTFKGAQPATRYEIASIIARSLAYVDFDKASKQDVEMLKRLVVEFSDELSALGVRVDELDSRVAVLEKDLGGWSLAGVLEFDAKFVDDDDTARGVSGKSDFDIDKYRIWLKRRIDEKTSFTARLGAGDAHANGAQTVQWEQYYVTTTLPYDIEFTFGRAAIDWEGDLGLYDDDDAWWGDFNRQMFKFKKDWGMASLELVFARAYDSEESIISKKVEELGVDSGALSDDDELSLAAEYYLIAGLLNFDFSEKVSAGIMTYYLLADDDLTVTVKDAAGDYKWGQANNSTFSIGDGDILTLGAYAKFKFHPSVELKGIYYYQDMDLDETVVGEWDNTNAWKVILDIDQDLLKFTSLWLEYAQIEGGFFLNNQPYAVNDALLEYIAPGGFLLDDTSVFGVRATQQWNDKWSTWERYWVADPDNYPMAKTDNFTFAVGYQYNPAVYFELAYDVLDSDGYGYDSDDLIRFKTVVNF
jgi:hypothetical protein